MVSAACVFEENDAFFVLREQGEDVFFTISVPISDPRADGSGDVAKHLFLALFVGVVGVGLSFQMSESIDQNLVGLGEAERHYRPGHFAGHHAAAFGLGREIVDAANFCVGGLHRTDASDQPLVGVGEIYPGGGRREFLRPVAGAVGAERGQVAFFAKAPHDDFVFAGYHRNKGGHGHIAHGGKHAILVVELEQAVILGDGVFAVLSRQGIGCQRLVVMENFIEVFRTDCRG